MKDLEKIINTVKEASEKSRREGFLALQEEIEELDETTIGILKTGLRLAVDGIDFDNIEKILTNIVNQEKDENKIRLKNIQKEAVFCIFAGFNTRILLLKLFSFMNKQERRHCETNFFNDDLNFDDFSDDSEEEEIELEPDPPEVLEHSEFLKQAGYIINISYKFAFKARREGLLMLEDELEDLDEEFIKEGLRLVVDGTDSVIINDILSNKIKITDNDNLKRLYKIQKEAVLCIQAGDNPELIIHRMISYIDNSELKIISKNLEDIEFFKENIFEDINVLEKEGFEFPVHAANILYRAYKFSEKSKNGRLSELSSLIDQEKKSGRDIFEYGIQFASNEIISDIIDIILSNQIVFEKDQYIKRAKIIQKEAVLGICNNENPEILFHYLLSFLDDKELEEIKQIFSATKFAEKLNEILKVPKKTDTDNIKNYSEELEDSIGSMEVISFFNRPYDLLKDADKNHLEKIFKNEHPKTIAVIVARLSCGSFCEGGVETVVNILRLTDRLTKKKIISSWQADDPELADEIKGRMFLFDDIVIFERNDIVKFLKEVDSQEMAVALKGASLELQNKIFECLSSRAAAMMKEDMEYMGPVKLRSIEEAQQKIIGIIRRLEENGEINISG